MADITINVSYNPNAPTGTKKITVDQEPHIDFGATRTIQWVLVNPPPAHLIELFHWSPNNPLNPPAEAEQFVGTDHNTNSTLNEQAFAYDIAIWDGTMRVEDPEIVNDPGGGHFRLFHSPK